MREKRNRKLGEKEIKEKKDKVEREKKPSKEKKRSKERFETLASPR